MHKPAGRVGILARKSKIVEEGTDANSIEAQVTRGTAWAGSNAGSVHPDHVYRENVSGYKATAVRDEMERALVDMERGEFDTLWCYALDRLTRRGAIAVANILARGGRFYFDWDRLDSADERDLRMILWRAEDAREYSQRLAANILGTKSRQRALGEIVGKPAYGWRIVPSGKLRKVERDPATWWVVERIYRERAEGRGRRQIARGLNADGIPSPRGKQWATQTVSMIVENPIYEGWQVVIDERHRPVAYRDEAGERVSVLAPGVEPLDAALVSRARGVEARGPSNFGGLPGTAVHLLTETLTCAGCGGPGSGAGAGATKYYRCSRHHGGASCPAPVNVMMRQIEPYVVARMLAALSALDPADPGDQVAIAAVAARWTASQKPQETSEALEATRSVKDVERQLQRLMGDREAGLYDGPLAERFARRYRELQDAHGIAVSRRAELMGAGTLDVSWMFDHETLIEAWDAATPEERRAILGTAVASVAVERAPRGHRVPIANRTTITFVWELPEAEG